MGWRGPGGTSTPQESASRPKPGLRPPAPTITVDTSAVAAPYGESSRFSSSHRRERSSSIERRPLLSSESPPTSPCNISSHAFRENNALPDTQNLLTVPGTCSRRSSLDHAHSAELYGGETLISTPTQSDYDGFHGGSGGPLSHGLESDDLSKVDPAEGHKSQAEDNPFAFSSGHLSKLFNPKNLNALRASGGPQGLMIGLRTDLSGGLSLDETALEGNVSLDIVVMPTSSVSFSKVYPSFATPLHSTTSPSSRHASSGYYVDRKRIFGTNRLPEKKSKNLLQIMWMTFNDKVLIILTIVATVSLILGLYQDFGQSERYGGPKVRWVEGVTIMVAVAIVVIVGSLNDYQKEQQFLKLNKKKEDRIVKAIRSGIPTQISIYDVLAGDVLYLEPGDLVPADGVFIAGHNVRCDESSITGESDQKKKTPGGEAMAQIEAGASADQLDKLDPFIISGSKVLEGAGTYLVTSVGMNSSYGKLIMAMTDDADVSPTPLQVKLSAMAEQITKVGCTVALVLFMVLFIKFLAQLKSNADTPAQKAQDFLQIVIVAITIIVIAVPEGLPLAVTLALAFAMTRMFKENNLVRILSSCETMGNATTICSDKTGTITTNKMTVVVGRLGPTFKFGVLEETDQSASNSLVAVPISKRLSLLAPEVKNILLQSIAINSTAFEGVENGKHTFIGSKTETALLSFAKEYLAMGIASNERANADVAQVFPFDSSRKCMATVVRLPDSTYRMFVKGASEILLERCTQTIADVTTTVKTTKLTKDNYNLLNDVIKKYSIESLRTISIVYREFRSWPPPRAETREDNLGEVFFEDVFQEMVFLGVVGIQDPLRPGVKEAVKKCQDAGVSVRMVTGDNIGIAKAIAKECGIYNDGGIVLEGPAFRRLPSAKMDEIVPRLQVLARSSPEDKRILVRKLRDLGETVAVTGDGTNDGPALRAADIGFSMNSGTEVAKEASSIILMDDDFSSIVKALEWGRAVNDAVRKFLQFQLTVNITAVIVTFVSAIANPNEDPILTPVQLLWVNLIMDTFAALALATDPPTPSVLKRKPEPKSARLITLNMWKMIIGQSIYQLIVTLALNFAGNKILGYNTEYEKDRLETLIFNIYVWMQVFNQLNNRRLDNKLNVFEGISRNLFFIGINVITIGGQVIIISVGGSALSTIRLDARQWALSIALGAISIPVAVLIRFIPNDFLLELISHRRGHKQIPRDERFEWNPALENVREQLTLLKNIRGGRLKALKFTLQGPREPLLSFNQDSIPGTPNTRANGDTSPSHKWTRSRSSSALGPAAVMAGVIAGSIAGWSPVARRNEDDDSSRVSSSRPRVDLES